MRLQTTSSTTVLVVKPPSAPAHVVAQYYRSINHRPLPKLALGQDAKPGLVLVYECAKQYYGLTDEEMRTRWHGGPRQRARTIAITLCYRETAASAGTVARLFGLKNHTTVLYQRNCFLQHENDEPWASEVSAIYAAIVATFELWKTR